MIHDSDKASPSQGELGPAIVDDGHISYQGSLLIAMPGLNEPAFAHSVVYVCRHDEEHAMGLVLNHPIEGLDLGVMFKELNIPEGSASGDPRLTNQPVFRGGPVQNDRGFVLHSLDYRLEDATLPVALSDDAGGVGLTASRDILVDLARGEGPARTAIMLGYAGWGPGQLENEMAHNAWIVAPATPELLYADISVDVWARALASLGIEPGHLSGTAGTA